MSSTKPHLKPSETTCIIVGFIRIQDFPPENGDYATYN